MNKRLSVFLFACLLLYSITYSQNDEIDTNAIYQIYHKFQGENRALSYNTSTKELIMEHRLNVPRQYWNFKKAANGGYYISNVSAGEDQVVQLIHELYSHLLLKKKSANPNQMWNLIYNNSIYQIENIGFSPKLSIDCGNPEISQFVMTDLSSSKSTINWVFEKVKNRENNQYCYPNYFAEAEFIDTLATYQMYNRYQTHAKTIAFNLEKQRIELASRHHRNLQLWKFSKLPNGYFYISNAGKESSKVMTADPTNVDNIYLSFKQNKPEQMWDLKRNEGGYIKLHNLAYGSEYALDCSSVKKTGSLFVEKTSSASGQQWYFVNTPQTNTTIISIRASNTEKKLDPIFKASFEQFLKYQLETLDPITLDACLNSYKPLPQDIKIVIEFVKNNKLSKLSFKYGDTINVCEF